MSRMLLVLRGSSEQDQALATLLDNLHDPTSAVYHQWLSPEEFGRRFGAGDEDIQTLTTWLRGQGFQVDSVARSRRLIEFSGTASQIEAAFRTSIRRVSVRGKVHYANGSDPAIPAALESVVVGISTLHDFQHQPHSIVLPDMLTVENPEPGASPALNLSGAGHALAPADYAVIYNINPLLQAGIDGTGTTIAVVGRSNINIQDIADFRALFGLTANNPQVVVNGTDPGDLGGGEELEAVLDATWAGATAPGATVKFVVSKSTNTTDGVDLSAQYIVNNNLANVMTESFGSCEADFTRTQASMVSSLAQQAATEGITWVVSTGDSGSAGCDDPSSESTASGPLSVNLLASNPYVVAVGGTQFNENSGTYWSAANGGKYLSALSFIPENVWNASGTGSIWAAGGGVSAYFTKPSWQTGVAGIPNDGARDIPDISLTAATHDPYALCIRGSCHGAGQLALVGGTSASTPAFAGIMALVNQKTQTRQGQANTVLYRLAAQEQFSLCNGSNTAGLPGSSCIFNDVTVGNNAVPGQAGYGSSNPSYSAGGGYDLATGLGSVNAANLVNSWSGAPTGGSTLPYAVSLTPSNATASPNVAQNFTVAWASPAGQPGLVTALLLIQDASNATPTTVGACYMEVVQNGAVLFANDNGAFTNGNDGTGAPWAFTVANSHCQLNGLASSLVQWTNGGSSMQVTLNLQFMSAWAGKKLAVWMLGTNMNYKSGPWQQMGTITVSGAPPSFALASSAASAAAGGNGNSTVTVVPGNGFASAVTLTAPNWPAGITGSFGTNPTYGSSNVTITVGSGVAAGAYSLVVSGTSGTLSASTTIPLTVTAGVGGGTLPYGVSVTPSTAVVAANVAQNWTFSWASPTGQPLLLYGYALIQDSANPSPNPIGGCYLRVIVNGAVQFADDSAGFSYGNTYDGYSWTGSPANSHCQLLGPSSLPVQVSTSGTNMSVTSNLKFTSAWSGRTLAVWLSGTNWNYQNGPWTRAGTIAVQ